MRARDFAGMGLAATLAAAATFVATSTADRKAVAQTAATPPGRVRLFYELVQPDGGKATANDEPCEGIDFYQEYFVLRFRNGAGRIVPLTQVKTLRWEAPP